MRQGRRSDLEEIKAAIEEGKEEKEIAAEHFSQWVVYRRSFTAYRDLYFSSTRTWKTKVVVVWGETGTGKSTFCWDQAAGRSTFVPGDFQWFDGYHGQDIVILDDYRGEYPIAFMLRLLDRFPMQVPIKGGFTSWSPRKVYITSNVAPQYWYPDVDGPTLRAFLRRIETIHHVTEPLF